MLFYLKHQRDERGKPSVSDVLTQFGMGTNLLTALLEVF